MSKSFSYEEAAAEPTASSFSYEDATGEPAKEAGAARKLGDLGLSLARGVIAVPEAAVGLADIPTGGRVGRFLENKSGAIGFRPKEAKDILASWQSDDLQGKQKEFQDADGLMAKAGVALSNPSLIANTVAESAALMGAGAVPARALLAAAPRLGAMGAAAIGEGAVGAGSAAETIRQETADGLLTPKQAALAAGSGVATAAFGAAGGAAARRLGIADIDTALVNGTMQAGTAGAGKGLLRRTAEGVVAEGFLEELPQSLSEQALQNIALDRPWQENLDAAAVMGTLAGGVMGGGAAALTRSPAQAPDPIQDEIAGKAPPAAPPAPTDAPVVSSQTVDDGTGTPKTTVRRQDGSVDENGVQVTPPSPNLQPSEVMGIDPNAGPLSRVAADAVDGPAAIETAGRQAEQEAAAMAPSSGTEPASIEPAGNFAAVLDTDDVYQGWSNVRDGSDRTVMRSQMDYIEKSYGGRVTPDNAADVEQELATQFKWFRAATPDQRAAALTALMPPDVADVAPALAAKDNPEFGADESVNVDQRPPAPSLLDQVDNYVNDSGFSSPTMVAAKFGITVEQATNLLRQLPPMFDNPQGAANVRNTDAAGAMASGLGGAVGADPFGSGPDAGLLAPDAGQRPAGTAGTPAPVVQEGDAAPVPGQQLDPALTDRKAQAQQLANGLDKGDAIVTSMGDRIEILDVIRDKAGNVTSVLPKPIPGEPESGRAMDLQNINALLTPQPYYDPQGNRQMDEGGRVEKRLVRKQDAPTVRAKAKSLKELIARRKAEDAPAAPAAAPAVEATGVEADYKKAVDAWNAKVEVYKAASPAEQEAMLPVMEAEQARLEQGRQGVMKKADAEFKRKQAEQREQTRTENAKKYGAMPTGTRIGIAGQEKNDSAFWEKTGPDEWTRNGIGSDKPTKTSADMEGNRTIAAAAPAPAVESEKAKWIKATIDKSRLNGANGVQIAVAPNGGITFLGNPNSNKDGKALLANYEQALKAGATQKEIADALTASKRAPAAIPSPTTTTEPTNALQTSNAVETTQTRQEKAADVPEQVVATPDAIVPVKTVYGDTVNVRQSDLDGDRKTIPTFTKEGKRKIGSVVARDNLDPTGEKQAAQSAEDANSPMFDVITRKGGGFFATRMAAAVEQRKRGLTDSHEVVEASTLGATDKGFVVKRKKAAAATPALEPASPAAAPFNQPPFETADGEPALAKREDGTLKNKNEYTADEWSAYTKSVIDAKLGEPAKPSAWSETENGFTKRPVHRYSPDPRIHWATVQNPSNGVYVIEYRIGDKVVSTEELGDSLTAVKFHVVAKVKELDAKQASHQDPGEKPEAATKGVVSDSLKTAAKNEDTKPSEMRKWLLAEIDKELLQAPDRADYDEAVKRLGEKDAIAMYTGNGMLGKNTETGFITFDVPGDGKFKVRNSMRGLLEFRKNVNATQGFKDNGQKTVKPEQNDGAQRGSGGQMAAVTNMIEEGDFEAARDFAEAVGIKLEDVKVPRGERKPQWETFLKDGTVPPPPNTAPMPEKKTAAQENAEKLEAEEAERRRPKDTGWNMAGTGYAGKRYIGRNITLADGREVVARIYENAGRYNEVEVKVDGARKFTVTDDYNAQDKADAFIRTLTSTGVDAAAPAAEPKARPAARVTPQISGNPEKFIKVAADSVRELRSVDVDRVLTETPVQFRAEVAGYIKDRRKDLADEVDDVMADLRGGNTQSKAEGSPTDFIPAPDGGLDYGEITPEMSKIMRRQAGKIRLRRGDDTQGLVHIEARHKADFAALGFTGAVDFISQVASGFTKIYKGNGAALDVVIDDEKRGMLIVQLEPAEDGDFYDIKTATPIRRAQFKNKEPLWERAGPSAPVADGNPPSPKGQSGSSSVAQPPEGFKPAGEPFYRDGELTQGYAPFDLGQRVTMKESGGQSGVIDLFISPDKNGVFDGAMVKFDNGVEQIVKLNKLEAAATPAGAPQAETPKLSQAEARELMEWQDLGQKGGIKTHVLTFYESKADKDAKRGRMVVATVTKEADAKQWVVEATGERMTMLGAAKKKAEEAGMARAVADGFVEPAAAEQRLAGAEQEQGSKAKTAKTDTTVDNFGEKLPPARRNMAAKLSEDLTDDKIATLPLSQIWPAAENDAIEDIPTAAVAYVLRDAIPAKPRVAYKVKSWVSKVKVLRDFAAQVVRGDISRDNLMEEMQKAYALRDLAAKIKLLEQIDRAKWKQVGDVSEAPNAVRYEGGQSIPTPSTSVTIDGKNHWLRGSGNVLDHLDAIKALLGDAAPEAKMQFEIRQESRGDRKVFINKKGDKEQRRLMEFATVEEARKAVKEQYADLVAAWEGVKGRDNITERDLRSDANRERAGKDHRKGRDVTAEEFEKQFGFRGGEFGSWMKQGTGAQERQFMLNSSYDALMDLSDLLGIPPKAISLEGSLGIAFGSRGSGWASAHFEPSNLVINLTKTRGAGALAHEWFHALDNYFARKRGGEVAFTGDQNAYRRENYVTYKTTPMMVRKDGRGTPLTKERLAEWRKSSPESKYLTADQWMEDPSHKQGVRAEVEQAFADLVKTLDASPMLKRARALDGVKDAEGYWSRVIERAARSFENYIQTRMMEQGYHNDFLANVRAAPEVGKNLGRYPYLLPSEIAPVSDAFQALFDTIQTKEDDAGNVAMFSQGLLAPASPGPKPTPDQIQRLVDKVQKVALDVLPVTVIGNPSQVPGLQVPAGAKPTGVLTGGRIYLFSDNIRTAGEAYATLFHELFHLGLQKVIPAEDYAAMLAKFSKNLLVQRFVREWKASPEGVEKAGTMPAAAYDALAAEEALAMVSEELSADGIGTNRLPGLVKAMLSWLANVADRLGFPGNFGDWMRGLTRTDAEKFVSDMVRAVLGGEKNLGRARTKYGTELAQMTQQSRLSAGAATAQDQTMTAQFKKWFGDWEAAANRKFLEGQPVATLTGNEFRSDGVPLTQKVPQWYAERGVTTVELDGVGPVRLDEQAVKNSLSHGMGRDKAAAFAAVPDVLKKGRIIHREPMAGGRDAGMVYHVAAPVRMGGRDFVADVLVRADKNTSRMYVHEVVLKEKLQQTAFKTGADAAEAGMRTGAGAGAIRSVLQDVFAVNPDTVSKVVDAAGKPLVVYHGTQANFSAFSEEYMGGGADALSNMGDFGDGFYFTKSASDASGYAGKGQGANVMPVYLSVKNPIDAERLMEIEGVDGMMQDPYPGESLRNLLEPLGYDGIIVKGGEEIVAFRPEQIKSAIGNNGQFDLQNPDIRFRSPRELAGMATDQLNTALKSVTITSIKQAAGYKATDLMGIALGGLGRRQLVEIYGKDLPLDKYNELATQMEADKNEYGAEADTIATEWGKLKDEGALANIMHDATLAKIDPDKPLQPGDDPAAYNALKMRFSLMSKEAKETYRKARDGYKRHHANVRKAIKERIERSQMSPERRAALIERMDSEFFTAMKGVYFPLARFGKYVVVVRGADGKVETAARAETMAEADALRRNLLTGFPAAKGYQVGKVILSREFVASRDAVGRGFMQELYEAMDKQDMDPAMRAEMEDTLGQLYLSSLPDVSWAKHGIHRKGTPGFSQDARRAYAQNMFHGARYLSKLRYSDLMQNELKAMQDHVDRIGNVLPEEDGFNGPRMQRVVDEFYKRHDSLMNPNSHPLSTALTSIGFMFHLGLSPASALVNMTQTAFVAYPVMGAKWGFAKSGAALLKASKQATQGLNDITKFLDKDERRAYDEAVRSGTIDVTMAHDLAGIAQGEDAGVMWRIRPAMRAASYLFHHAERFNRQVTFVAAYRLARETGAAHEAAFEQATKATYDGHFDYSAGNRPRFMQGNAAKVILLFKSYAQNMVYTLARSAYQSVNGLDAKERAEARKALGGILATHAMAAGVLGLPMVTTILAAISAAGGDDDEPFDAQVALQNMLADTFGQKPAEVMTRGLSRLGPWDISGRVGLDRLIFPDIQEGLEGQRLAESFAFAALGPVGGIFANVAKGLQEISEGHVLRGFTTMMPAALRGPLAAARYADEGAVDKTGIPIVQEVSTAGIVGQALGFSPSEVRNATEGKRAVLGYDRALNERRQELMTQYARGAMKQDTDAMQEARDEIRAFNEKNPNRRITMMHLTQSIRGRQRRVGQADNGVYLPRNRREAMEQGRFALAE